MYKLVYNTYATPMEVEHALENIEAAGLNKDAILLLIDGETSELLGGKLVEPEPLPEPKEGEEAPPPPAPAPAYDALNLALWKKLSHTYPTMTVTEQTIGQLEPVDQLFANAYRTSLAANRIAILLKEWDA